MSRKAGLNGLDLNGQRLQNVGTPTTAGDALPQGYVASAAELFASVENTKPITAKTLADAQKFVALTDASTVSPDLSKGINFKWTRSAASTLGPMSNLKEGWTGTLKLDGPGAITLDSSYDVGSQTISWSTAAGTFDYLDYQVVNASGGAKSVRVSFRKAS
jgi:hypothetical protein